MTRREEAESIIRRVLCVELHVQEDARGTISEGVANELANAVRTELERNGLLKAGIPSAEVQLRISEAIALGRWQLDERISLSPRDCATRIYSGLEIPPAYLVGA